MPHESPVVERVRLAVLRQMQKHGITQRALAQRLNIAASSINGFLQGKQSLELRHLDALAERLGATAAELVAHTQGLATFELTDQEARLMNHVRKWPPAVRAECLSVVDFFMGFVPEDEPSRQVLDHWNRMDAGERRHFLHLAVYLRDTGLPPDVRAGLGLPPATPEKGAGVVGRGRKPSRKHDTS